MTDKLDPAEVLRELEHWAGSEPPGPRRAMSNAHELIRQMQADIAETDRRAREVAVSEWALEPLAHYLPKVDPLVEVLGEFGFHDGAVEAFRATIAKRGGTITWKDGV